jgi:hypothetical protein
MEAVNATSKRWEEERSSSSRKRGPMPMFAEPNKEYIEQMQSAYRSVHPPSRSTYLLILLVGALVVGAVVVFIFVYPRGSSRPPTPEERVASLEPRPRASPKPPSLKETAESS